MLGPVTSIECEAMLANMWLLPSSPSARPRPSAPQVKST
jgi:hypothetical protein